jgi:hypothetical protein
LGSQAEGANSGFRPEPEVHEFDLGWVIQEIKNYRLRLEAAAQVLEFRGSATDPDAPKN